MDLELLGNVFWEGEHIRLVHTSKDISRELVKQVTSSCRKIRCKCVCERLARLSTSHDVTLMFLQLFSCLTTSSCLIIVSLPVLS